jgi:integrase
MPVIELTDRFCKSARGVEAKQTDYYDEAVKGLCLTVSPGGTKTFNLIYTRPGDGKRARMKLGRYPELQLAKARERARGTRAEVGEGNDPVAAKRAVAASMTVHDLVENYVVRHASTKRTADAIARRLRKNVSEAIGGIKVADLHRRDLTRVIDAIKDRGANIEANRVFEDLRAMVRWARGRGDLDENLMEGMRKPSEAVERDRVLSADEIRTMWEALTTADMRESTRNIIRLCLVTGQRVGEVCGMTRNEIDLDIGVWVIPAARSKNKREHVVPLPSLAIDIIREQLEADEELADRKKRGTPTFVFPAPGGRAATTNASISKAIKRTQNEGLTLGILPFTPHDLRRSCATGMEELGISPFVVGHVLNHISVTKASITSRVYARYSYENEKREALNLWSDRLRALVSGGNNLVSLAAGRFQS